MADRRGASRTGAAETNRVEAFSDGVLAIVVTLLVLEIHMPAGTFRTDAELWIALATILPKLVAWVVSFLFILVFWVAHHYLFVQLERVDRGVLWLNGLFLLAASFTPFPTGLVGDHPRSVPAVAVLAAAFLTTSLAFTSTRAYATACGLFRKNVAQSAIDAALRRSLISPMLYATALIIAFLSPSWALAIIVTVPLIYVFPDRVTREH